MTTLMVSLVGCLGFAAMTVAGDVAPPLTTAADGGFTLAQARTAAEKHWSRSTNPAKSLVQNVAEIKAPELATLFPGSRFFSVDVFNPRSRIAGPPTLASAVVARGAEVTFLTSDEEVTRFLSQRASPAATKGDALQIAIAFCALRSYEIRTSPVQGEAKPNENWSIEARQEGEGWTVLLAAMVDKHIKACCRYTVMIDAQGKVKATPGKPVGMPTGGYD